MAIQGQADKVAGGIHIVFGSGGGIAAVGLVVTGAKKLQEQKI
jgi:hypothetical protein